VTRYGFQELLAVPCGQVAWRASKSTEKAALPWPVPALAWAELSSVIPNVRAACMISSAEG
jgi:hypothetical protein